MIDDIQAGSDLLRHAVHKSPGRHRGRRLRAIVGLATGTTQIGRQALYNTVREAGVIHPHFVPATLAAAVGSGLAVEEPRGRMVIDWGSGLTEIAVLSLGGICVARSIRLGGDSLAPQFRTISPVIIVFRLVAQPPSVSSSSSRRCAGPAPQPTASPFPGAT